MSLAILVKAVLLREVEQLCIDLLKVPRVVHVHPPQQHFGVRGGPLNVALHAVRKPAEGAVIEQLEPVCMEPVDLAEADARPPTARPAPVEIDAEKAEDDVPHGCDPD
jgi:hypothetical protein